MKRRDALKLTTATTLAAAGTLAAPAILRSTRAAGPIRIGAVAPKTGPLAGGATVSHWPNIYLWVEQVNARGGLQLADGPAMVELIEYDDQTNPGETIQAVQRLANQDDAHFILAPYGTGLNIAAAPIFDRLGYPQIAVTAITDQIEELAGNFPNMFFTLGSTTAFASAVAEIVAGLRDSGQIGNRVAMVNVADAFGIELAAAGRPIFEQAGLEIVYDQSYPLGTQDLSPVVRGAKDSQPDAFVAWSYPPDTFGLAEQAMIENLDVRAYYTAVATCFPAYRDRFGASINNVLGAGGVNPDDPRFQEYAAAHQEVTGQEPDYWASATTYSSLQILEQAIEAIGAPDREGVSEYLKANTFDTVLGDIEFNEHNNNERYWTCGQWQDGVFHGVASTGREGAVDVRLKEGWA